MDYNPAQLPNIDEVFVLILAEKIGTEDPTPFVLDVGWRFAIHTLTGVTDETAVKMVTDTWRALPAGEKARCHIPPYGLRFFKSGQKILEASICWQCNNMFIRVGEETTLYGFDSESDAAQRLLRLMHYLSGRYLERSDGQIMSLQDVF